MKPLIDFRLEAYFARHGSEAPDRWVRLAEVIYRTLDRAIVALEDRNLYFESYEAKDLSQKFKNFVLSYEDKAKYDLANFEALWEELLYWGDQTVYSGGREKSLAKIGHLPQSYSW